MKFCDRLKQVRIEKKLSREDLAGKIGVSYSAIAKYETGKREPDYDTLVKLSDFFNVTVDYLLGKSRNPNLTEKDEKDIAKRMAKIRKDLEEGTGEDGLNFMGEPMNEEAIESLLEALEYAERQATRINKKYAPNKYKNRKNK